MKILLFIILGISGILCEVPPPYPSRGFRPSPQLSLPQRTYGVPNVQPAKQLSTKYGPPPSNAEPLDPAYRNNLPPIKLTQDSRYRTIPDSVWFNKGNLAQRPLPTRYGVPDIDVQNNVQSVPQTIYGVPKQVDNSAQFGPFLAQPQRNYGAPDRAVVDAATLEEVRELKQLLQKIEAQRIIQQNIAQYLAPQVSRQPDNRFVQNLPTQNNAKFRSSLTDQYLPIKEPENFRKFVSPTTGFNVQQEGRNLDQNPSNQNNVNTAFVRGDQGNPAGKYIPPTQNLPNQGNQENADPSSVSPNFAKNPTNSWNNLDLPNPGDAQSNNNFPNSVPFPNPNIDVQKVEVTQFGNRDNNGRVRPTTRPQNNNGNGNDDQVNNRYIPPTIESPVQRNPTPTTQRPFVTSSSGFDYPMEQDPNTESPNVSVATAVAAPQDGQQFFLLQPDGTYQRIIVQKREGGSQKDNIYGANYVLQNVRTDPNIVYAPLISLVGR
ncbi:uncharacterized protein [Diabrotica undecimpunctata]|uniref:uncharacterized protein n=1 Tax=Diabrotica undecimpunctata TaxID=50387 RepID=UPI003B6324AB